MEEVVVVRKEIVLKDKDISKIEDFLQGELDKFKISIPHIEFGKFNLATEIYGEQLGRQITVKFKLYKKTDKKHKNLILLADEDLHGFNDLFKTFNVSTKHSTLPDKVEVCLEFVKEGNIKDNAFYQERKNILSSMNRLEKPNILQYVDFANKAELFRGLYFLIEQEDIYNAISSATFIDNKESAYLKDMQDLMDRLEYYGYDFDYYESKYDLYNDKMTDFIMSKTLLNTDEILKYFILATIGMIYEGKKTGIDYRIKSKIYDIFYQKLETEGFYKK